jgi:hypothetical protein
MQSVVPTLPWGLEGHGTSDAGQGSTGERLRERHHAPQVEPRKAVHRPGDHRQEAPRTAGGCGQGRSGVRMAHECHEAEVRRLRHP